MALVPLALLSGCSRELWEVGFLPPESKGLTSHTDEYIALWNGGWIAAFAIGILVWLLILFCVIRFRRRRHERGLPVQLAYHMPIEILYTVVPVILVVGFFFVNVKTIDEVIYDSTEAEEVIEVVGKQWSWDFNYVTHNVHYAGVQVNLDGTEEPGRSAPTLYLPADTPLEIRLRSRDVIHSFWVPAFLEKRDMFPGRTEKLHLTALKEGTYVGKCAELCGEYHSEMLFNVKVVSPAEFQQEMNELSDAGKTGLLGPEYDRTEWYQNPYKEDDTEEEVAK